jgi:N-acylneuraminate cytidylyltransferase
VITKPTISALKHKFRTIETAKRCLPILLQPQILYDQIITKEAFEVYQKENYDSLFNTRNHQKIRKITGTKFQPFNYT